MQREHLPCFPLNMNATCSKALYDVALVCYNDALHVDSTIAERAQGILKRSLQQQPPCTVKYITDISQKGVRHCAESCFDPVTKTH
jgi:hypothetical protein